MNLNNLFEIQDKLDKHIVKEKGLEGQDLLDQKILALQVELGELAQNWRGFKFWSKDQEPRTYEKCHVCQGHGETVVPAFPDFEEMEQDMCPVCEGDGKSGKNPLLEEYVDCLHFILSIGLETLRHGQSEIHLIQIYLDGMRDVPSFAVGNKKEIVSVFRELFKITSEIGNSDFKLKELIGYFDTLGGLLGFTREQIEDAYMQKNEINHARQKNGY